MLQYLQYLSCAAHNDAVEAWQLCSIFLYATSMNTCGGPYCCYCNDSWAKGLDGWWQMWAKRHGAAGDWRQGCRRLALNRWKNWWKIRLTFKPHKDCTCKAIGLLGWEAGLIRWTFGLCRYSLGGSFSGSVFQHKYFLDYNEQWRTMLKL